MWVFKDNSKPEFSSYYTIFIYILSKFKLLNINLHFHQSYSVHTANNCYQTPVDFFSHQKRQVFFNPLNNSLFLDSPKPKRGEKLGLNVCAELLLIAFAPSPTPLGFSGKSKPC